jgi:hypothetical protein
MAIRSDQLRFRNGLATGLKQDPTGAGRAVAQAIQPDVRADTLALFLFPDGLTVNFDRLLAGLEGQLGLEHPLPLLGGNASDNLEFKPTSCTFQYCDDQVISDGIAWTLLSGQAKIAWAVNHACVPVSVESKVTRCEGNVIYEIDGRPALDVVKGYLTDAEIEDWAMAIATFPLGFKVPELAQDYDEYIIRGMVGGRDEPTGSVTIHTEVTEGTSVWVTRRDYEKLAQGVERIAREIKAKLGNCTPKLVFHFDCAARGKALLREQQKLELLQTLQRHLGPESPWLGFYTLGEIGPVGRRNYLHNFTLVMAVIY